MTTNDKIKRIAEINEVELAARIGMACIGVNPTVKNTMSAQEILDKMDRESGIPNFSNDFRRAARAAMEYWKECLDKAQGVN